MSMKMSIENEHWNSIWTTLKAFSTTCNVYLSRINLNIAITDMVDRKSSGLNNAICRQAGNETDFSKRDVSINPNMTSSNIDDIPEEKFTWTNKQQGLMLGLVIHWLWIEVISAILNNASISGLTFEIKSFESFKGGYFYGYTAMMPFGGYLPTKIGLRNTVTICMIGSCLISFSYTFFVGIPTAG